MKMTRIYWGFAAVLTLGMLAPKTFGWQGSDLDASVARGKTIYNSQCVTCHREKGEGIKDVYPPLAKSDYMMANRTRSIGIVVNGLTGQITVNGAQYDGEMLSVDLPDQQVSDVLNYVRNSWGNKGDAIQPEEVAPQKKAK
jgi:mono/diheme cytochrome c family protein